MNAPKPGAKAAAAQGEALLETIDLARSQNGYNLSFKWGKAGVAQLTMSGTELRQWLGILYRLFDAAEWPKHAWPPWFGSAGNVSSTAPQALH